MQLTRVGASSNRSMSSGRTRSLRREYLGGRGRPVVLANPGTAKPAHGGERGARHARSRGGFDELGLSPKYPTRRRLTPISRRRRAIPVSRSSRQAATTVASTIRLPRRTSFPSAGPRSIWATWVPMAPRPPGSRAAAATAATRRSRTINSLFNRPECEARPMSRSTATPVRASRSMRPRRGRARGRGKLSPARASGAPAWAGIIAIVDQGRALQGIPSLDGPTQTLPSLYAAPSSDFYSVAPAQEGTGFPGGGFMPFARSGFTDFNIGGGRFGKPTPGATANTATGLGSPFGPALVSNLVSSTLTVPLSTTPIAQVRRSTAGNITGTTPTRPAAPLRHKAKLHERKLAGQQKHGDRIAVQNRSG